MSEAVIEVERRAQVGKGASGRLRAAGQIPAVLYGADKEPVAIQVPRRLLLELFQSGGHENRIFLLKLAGTEQTRHAMIRDLAIDPTTSQVLHVDFQRIVMDRKLRVKVRLELDGVPQGVKNEGGVLDFVTRELEVECLPSAIPPAIHADVSGLHVGHHLEARELTLPPGVAFVGDPHAVVASVKHARAEEVAAPAAAAEPAAEAAAEPEVIAKGKKEEGKEKEAKS
jgi:large subunit ribosomal protein L25